MLRTKQRRHARRAILRTRVLAAGTAVLLALGVAVGGTAPAIAAQGGGGGGNATNTNEVVYWQQLPGEVCVKPVFSSEDSTANPYSLPALGAGFAYSKVIIKAGSSGKSVTEENSVYTTDSTGGSLTAGDTFVHREKNSISHVIYCYVPSVPSAGNKLDCVTATNYPGRALTNGDHINMEIVRGGTTSQINAQIDIRQSQDPVSESGLVVRVNAPGGPYTLPITNDQKNSGVFAFTYSTYLTGSWTVTWVQFNSTYFNQNRDTTKFLTCGDVPTEELVTPTADSVPLTCDTEGSYTLDDVEGIRWFIGDDEVQPGTYLVSAPTTVTVRAEAIGPDYGLETDVQTEWTFAFTEPTDCEPPCLPASAVSYTYYNLSTDTEANPANSGLITVAAREGYGTELCDDFWVVAAAWNYTSPTSIWPQTLRSTDPAGTHLDGYVSTVGTYFFHAPVACGQGDVYASFTGMPYVGPELFGPSNPFSETFLHNMGFSGPNPTYLNTAPGCNVVNPIAPTANPIVECGTYGSIDVDAVASPYVGYSVYRGAAADNGSVAGLEMVNLEDATEGVFTVVAAPQGGYIFPAGTVRQWEFDLGEYSPCPVDVDLRLTYMEECAPDSTYTFRVRNAESVSVPYTYTVSGNVSLNGSGIASPGDSFFDLPTDRTNPAQSYTVTLHWGDGTTIVAESTTKASGRDKVCSLTVQPIVDIACATDGTYTIPTVLGVVWSIDGLTRQPGTYSVSETSTITLRATAVSGYVLYTNGQLSTTRDFTLIFTEPAVCAEPTFDGATSTTSACDNDTPWIDYSVLVNDPDGQLATTMASLTFVHPTDPAKNYTVELGDVTADEPLEGRILWPGASIDSITGEPTGWPGWAFADGEWVETAYDENFRWTRDLTEVTLTVNPEMQIAIAYPEPTEDCVTGPVELAPVATESTCLDGGSASYTLPAVTGVTWFVNGQQRDANTYPVLGAEEFVITFTIDANATGGPYALKAGATESFTFTFTDDEICDLPELPVTNAFIAFIEPTCELGQQLDPTNYVIDDPELARYDEQLSSVSGSTYTVVFVITDDDAVFFDSDTPPAGRTVSDAGKTLTFSGTLLGPDRSELCVTTIVLEDPVTYEDSCLLGASFTIERVEGILYTVTINDDAPFEVVWNDGETTRTYDVNEGDSVSVMPSPVSDRFTISPDPAPFSRTFEVYDNDCLTTLPLTQGSAEFVPASCLDATNRVTLESVEGVQWWINGTAVTAGPKTVTVGAVVVTATPLPGYGFPLEAQTRWDFVGVAVDEDCLPTLAFTGATGALTGLGIGALLMILVGFGVAIGRRQQA